jgi:hypothetical protein
VLYHSGFGRHPPHPSVGLANQATVTDSTNIQDDTAGSNKSSLSMKESLYFFFIMNVVYVGAALLVIQTAMLAVESAASRHQPHVS